MPGKSQRRRTKYSSQSKNKRGRPSHQTVAVQQPTATQAREPVLSLKVPASSASKSGTIAKLAAIQHPYMTTELRTIGILAGVILIILVVLAKVLP